MERGRESCKAVWEGSESTVPTLEGRVNRFYADGGWRKAQKPDIWQGRLSQNQQRDKGGCRRKAGYIRCSQVA